MRGDPPRKEADGLSSDAKAAGFGSPQGRHMPCGLFAFFGVRFPQDTYFRRFNSAYQRRGKTPPMATKALTPVGTPGRSAAKKRIRKIFGDIHEVIKMPNLIEVQRESYEQFLRSDHSIGYVSGLERRCVRSSRSATLLAPASWTSFITFWKTPNMTSPSAVSAGSPMPRR